MRAVDTNVIARAVVRDDAVQAEVADAILSEGAFVPLTVFLETAWLLRSRYQYSRAALVDTLRALLDMPDLIVDGAEGLGWALGRLERGGDIADLVHIVAARGATAFATFDGGVSAAAGPDSPVVIETLT